ncbi:uncharacterized protein LOC133891345 [Phragmites australis]|uniref:uncharacterized protein LOC133891345 n=1 Tax=Phragmites australis TaxID=29695 RepID=UPI002D77FB16|nr:uncharacterized protein LOC133891345 [Phragmites australis]
MGNCLQRSRRSGGGEHCAKKRAVVWVEEKVAENEEAARKGERGPAATEVKIRITRKQLEELLRRVDHGKQGGVPVREVISELLCVASTSSNFRHRGEGQWRPSTQSIPE